MADYRRIRLNEKTGDLDGTAIEFLYKKHQMKTKTLIAALVTVAAGIATYYFLRNRRKASPEPIDRTHHLTEVFTKAKQYSSKKITENDGY
jgi:hypothetical protein